MLSGNTRPVRDPSILRQGNTYYVFSTDPLGQSANNLPIRCSQDRVNWTACGHVFDQPPAWVTNRISGMRGLWAPDISYFNGLYHLYYAGSTMGSQASVIGLVTNTTLDPADLPTPGLIRVRCSSRRRPTISTPLIPTFWWMWTDASGSTMGVTGQGSSSMKLMLRPVTYQHEPRTV
jgi:hypothetical protein